MNGPGGWVAVLSSLYVLFFLGWIAFHWGGEENVTLIGDLLILRISIVAIAPAWRVFARQELENVRREVGIQRLRAAELEREMDDQRRTQVILERLATLDPLTEIYNRRHFYNLALKGIQRCIRYQHSICILMIDIDHFKLVNDKHGHPVGYKVIHAAANLLHEIVRNIDIVGRLGGDEFAVILHETPSHDGVLVAERIRLKIVNLPFQLESGALSTTVSIGVTCSADLSGDPAEMLEQLLKVADNALYEAKSKGRNQTIML